MNDALLGVVEQGRFRRLSPAPIGTASSRLTRIAMQAAQTPESAEIPLAEYEGTAIMVQGHDGGEWIYSAAIADKAGPILTTVVRQVFAAEAKPSGRRGAHP